MIADEVARALGVGVLFTSSDGRRAGGRADRRDPRGPRCGRAPRLDGPIPHRADRTRRHPGRRRAGADAPRRRRRQRPGPSGLRAGRRAGHRGRRPGDGARLGRRRAADHPRGGRDRGREQVPRRLPPRPVPAAAPARRLRRRARGRLSAGTWSGRWSWSPPRSTRRHPARSRSRTSEHRQWQERFSAAWRTVTAGIDATAPQRRLLLGGGHAAAGRARRPRTRRTPRGARRRRRQGRRTPAASRSASAASSPTSPSCPRPTRRPAGRVEVGSSDPRWRFDDVLRPARSAPADRAVPDTGELRAFAHDVLGDARRHRPGRGRPARDAPGAARHELQRRRGGAHSSSSTTTRCATASASSSGSSVRCRQ